MFDKWMKYSYAAQKHERHRLLRIVLLVFGLYVLYNSFTSFCVSVWVMKNNTMQPGLAAGDRMALISFAIPSLLAKTGVIDTSIPFKRGNIVLVDAGLAERRPPHRLLLDGALRFFTAQRASLYGTEDRLYLRRVIGLPGDEITMTNFVLRIKPAGGSYSLTEFELADKPYYPNIPQVPALWDESLPFSGNMDRIVLGEDECFVISDDRGNTNDSRTWGPVPLNTVAGKAAFRFWPPRRIGRP